MCGIAVLNLNEAILHFQSGEFTPPLKTDDGFDCTLKQVHPLSLCQRHSRITLVYNMDFMRDMSAPFVKEKNFLSPPLISDVLKQDFHENFTSKFSRRRSVRSVESHGDLHPWFRHTNPSKVSESRLRLLT